MVLSTSWSSSTKPILGHVSIHVRVAMYVLDKSTSPFRHCFGSSSTRAPGPVEWQYTETDQSSSGLAAWVVSQGAHQFLSRERFGLVPLSPILLSPSA